jgi:hypothetical protein
MRAFFHVSDFSTAVSAGIAHLGVRATDSSVQARTGKHEISRGAAHLSTIQHQPEMLGLYVLPTDFQAVTLSNPDRSSQHQRAVSLSEFPCIR